MGFQAKPSAPTAGPMKIHLYGSNARRCASHAPPAPTLTRTRGRTQQVPVSSAAMPPAVSASRSERAFASSGSPATSNGARCRDFSKLNSLQNALRERKLISVVNYGSKHEDRPARGGRRRPRRDDPLLPDPRADVAAG